MFSSCLENIEPEGIKDLRGAKAELLRAKTALEEANAAKVNAEAAFVQAQAKIQEAIAKQEEAKAAYEAAVARLKELEVEKQTALDQIEIEKAIAEAQAAIAEAEAQAAVYAAELERDLLNVQAEIAASQAALEVALKNLAIAKNTLTTEQQAAIASLESAVITARGEVEAKTVALENAAKQLAAALAEVDEVKANKLVMRMAELKLVTAQAALEGAQKAEAEAKAALELDPSVTDWEAKAEAYKAEIEKLDSEWYKKDGEIDDAMSAMRDSVSATGVITTKATDYTAYTGYPFNDETGFFSKIKGATSRTFPIGEVVVTAPVDEEGTVLFDGDFVLGHNNYTYDKEDVVIKTFEDRLKDLSKINAKTYETQIAIEEAKIAESKNNPYNKYNLEKYNDAVAAYNAGDVLAYFNKYVFDEDFDLTVAVKEYNDALKAMEAAVKNFNDNYDKYNPDYSEEYEAALAAQVKAYNDAAVVKAQDYQKAEDDNKYAYNKDVWAQATADWLTAVAKYTIDVTAATTSAGETVANMKTFVESYDAETADEATKETYAKYTAALAEVDKAEKAKTAAEAEHNKADEAWEKVDEAYQKAIKAADDKEAAAQKKADEALAKVEAAIKAKTPTFDPTYMTSLYAQVDAAKADLQEKVNAIRTVATDDLTDSYRTYYIDFELQKYYTVWDDTNGNGVEDSGEVFVVKYRVVDIPEFMVDITVDTEGTHYAAAPVAVADFVDKEYFKDNVVADLARNLTEVRYDYYIRYRDNYGHLNNDFVGEYSWEFTSYEGYPLALPSVEEYAEYANGVTSVIPQYIWDQYIYMMNNNFYPQYDGFFYYSYSPSMYAEVDAEMKIADLKADIEDLKKLPDFVKAIEAAQAEFEALVKENADKLAADKAEVEAFYAKYLAAEEKAADELEAIKAKNDVMKARYNAMVQVIADYCYAKSVGTTNVDALVVDLQANYEAAVKNVIFAEETVRQAEQAIEDVKAGIVSAADAAQRAYDRAAEELAVAISKLEKATAALENIIAAIYETGEVPETPETPETPEGGDDTTEGGDDTTEGGEETPAE